MGSQHACPGSLSIAKKLALFLVFSLAMTLGFRLVAAWILGSTLQAVAVNMPACSSSSASVEASGPSLTAMEGVAAKLAQGDLLERIPASGPDELARVSRSMNRTMKMLAGLLGDLRTGSVRLAASSMQLSSTSQEMSRAAGEIAPSTEAQREATEQEAAAMVELAASTGHIAGLVNRTGERSSHMVRLTAEDPAAAMRICQTR